MVGGISLGTNNMVSHGLDNGALGAGDLSVSAIGGEGPTSCILGSSGSSVGTSGSSVSSTGTSVSGKSLP
jgi:hypothetical protein